MVGYFSSEIIEKLHKDSLKIYSSLSYLMTQYQSVVV